MFGIGAQELIVILVVALVVFGPKRLPELARSLGKGMAEFRRASSELRGSFQEAENTIRESAKPPEAPAQAGDDLPDPAPEKKEAEASTQAAATEAPATETAQADAEKEPSEPARG